MEVLGAGMEALELVPVGGEETLEWVAHHEEVDVGAEGGSSFWWGELGQASG